LVHDPWRPVPGRGGHLDPQAGSCERGDLDQRRDVICFTSAPLQHGLEMVVRPQLVLRVAADQPGFDLCVALSRVESSGGVRQLSVGIQRHRGPGCLVSQWRQVCLQPLLLQLHPGERLRLSLAAAAWPQVAVNPGSGALPWGASGPDHRVITLRFDLAEARLDLEPLLNSAANCGE
jgi:putative CocE/NonD family hydrolase